MRSSIRSSLISSPEFTTNSMPPKCWRRIGGKIYLFKGGTTGAANTANESYSEFYASQIAKVMGIDAISYNLSRWKDTLCSTCALFYSYIPVGRPVRTGGMKAVRAYCASLGKQFTDALDDMVLLDAVICNIIGKIPAINWQQFLQHLVFFRKDTCHETDIQRKN